MSSKRSSRTYGPVRCIHLAALRRTTLEAREHNHVMVDLKRRKEWVAVCRVCGRVGPPAMSPSAAREAAEAAFKEAPRLFGEDLDD